MVDIKEILETLTEEERANALLAAKQYVRKDRLKHTRHIRTENIRKGREKAIELGILGGVRKRFSQTICRCGKGDSLKHERTCPRYRYIYRRIAEVKKEFGVEINPEKDTLEYAESLWDQVHPQRLSPKK